MAYSPVGFINPQYYVDYANWWLKGYQQATTTPLSMATDSSGLTQIVRAEITSAGFIKTSGGALFTPHFDKAYDLWIFPTAAEADANDTTNAIQVADNLSLGDTIRNITGEVFDTVASMKSATELKVGEQAQTQGYYSAGDGGGAVYLISSSQPADECGNHTLDNGNVAVLQSTSVNNMKQFGARADGAADDSSKINAAIVALSGGVVRVNSGTYDLGSTRLNVDNPITMIFEPGVVFQQQNTNVAIMAISDTSGVVIHGNKALFSHNRTSAGSNSLIIRGSDDVSIYDLRFDSSPKDAINITDSIASPGDQNTNITVKGCEIFNARRQGISVTHGRRINIEGNSFHDIIGDSPQAGVDLEANSGDEVRDVTIIGNQFYDITAQAGVIVAHAFNVVIDGNVFDGNLVGVTVAAVTSGADGGKSVVAVTPGDDRIEVTAHGYSVGDNIFLSDTGGGSMPTPLIENVRYRVSTVPTVDTFTLSTYYKIDPINITSAGVLPLTSFKQDMERISDIVISNNVFKNMLTSSINANTAQRLTISDNVVSGSNAGSADISLVNVDFAKVINNTLTNATDGEGIFLSGRAGMINGNTVVGAPDAGIRNYGTLTGQIVGNTLIDCGADSTIGMDIRYFEQGVIARNIIRDESALGVSIGIDMNGADSTNNILAENHLLDSSNGNSNSMLAVDSSNYISDTVVDDGAYEDGFVGSATFDPGSIADGDQEQTTVAVTNASLGDYAQATFSNNLQNLQLTAHVSAAGFVKCVFSNMTGAAVNLGLGTVRVTVKKA